MPRDYIKRRTDGFASSCADDGPVSVLSRDRAVPAFIRHLAILVRMSPLKGALDKDRPHSAFADIWTEFKARAKSKPIPGRLFGLRYPHDIAECGR